MTKTVQAEARSNNFIAVIGEDRNISFGVQASNIANMMMGVTTFPTRTKDLYMPSNKIETETVNLQILVSYDYREWLYFFKWMLKVKNNTESWQDFTKTIEVMALDPQGKPCVTFTYKDAFPMTLDDVQFSVQGEAVTVAFNVVCRYNDFCVKDRNGQLIDYNWNGELDG